MQGSDLYGYQLSSVYYPLMKRDVYVLPGKLVPEFFDHNWSTINPLVRKSILRMAKVPVEFYEDLPPGLRRETLQTVCSKGSMDFLLLADGQKLEYAAKATHPFEYYEEDPFHALSLQDFENDQISRGWRFDPHSGECLYVFSSEAGTDYVPSVELRVPVFYSRNITISYGLYKDYCKNRVIDPDTQPELSLPFDPFSARFAISDFIYAMLKSANSRRPLYDQVLGALKNEAAGNESVKALLHDQDSRDRLRHAPLGKLKVHLRLITNGLALPEASPLSFSSWYDVLDVLAFYSSRMKDLEKQRFGSIEIFRYFFAPFMQSSVDR